MFSTLRTDGRPLFKYESDDDGDVRVDLSMMECRPDEEEASSSPSLSRKEFMDLLIDQATQILNDSSTSTDRKRWCDAIREKKKEYQRKAKDKAQQDRLNACKYGSNWTCRLNAFLALSKKILLRWKRNDLVGPFTTYCQTKLKTDWIPYIFSVSSGVCPPHKNMKNKYFEKEESLHYMFTTVLDGIVDTIFGERGTGGYGRHEMDDEKVLFRASVVFGASNGLYMSNFQSGHNMYSAILCSPRRFEKTFPNVLTVIQRILVACPTRKYDKVKRIEHARVDTMQNLPWGCCEQAKVAKFNHRKFCEASGLWNFFVSVKDRMNVQQQPQRFIGHLGKQQQQQPPVVPPNMFPQFDIPPPTVGNMDESPPTTPDSPSTPGLDQPRVNPFAVPDSLRLPDSQQRKAWIVAQHQQQQMVKTATQTFEQTVHWVIQQVSLGCPRDQSSLVEGVQYEDHERMRQHIEYAVQMGVFGRAAQQTNALLSLSMMGPTEQEQRSYMGQQQQQQQQQSQVKRPGVWPRDVYGGRRTTTVHPRQMNASALAGAGTNFGQRLPMNHRNALMHSGTTVSSSSSAAAPFSCQTNGGGGAPTTPPFHIQPNPTVPPELFEDHRLAGESLTGVDDYSVFGASAFGMTTGLMGNRMPMMMPPNALSASTVPSGLHSATSMTTQMMMDVDEQGMMTSVNGNRFARR